MASRRYDDDDDDDDGDDDNRSAEGSSDEEVPRASAAVAHPRELHIMLSYQWDNQKLVEDFYMFLKEAQPVPIWMDKHGGMKDNIFER